MLPSGRMPGGEPPKPINRMFSTTIGSFPRIYTLSAEDKAGFKDQNKDLASCYVEITLPGTQTIGLFSLFSMLIVWLNVDSAWSCEDSSHPSMLAKSPEWIIKSASDSVDTISERRSKASWVSDTTRIFLLIFIILNILHPYLSHPNLLPDLQ